MAVNTNNFDPSPRGLTAGAGLDISNGIISLLPPVVGDILKTVTFTGLELVESGTNIDKILTAPAYTPVSALSTLLIEFYANYIITNSGTDAFRAQLRVGGVVQYYQEQRWQTNAGGGTRSGSLTPIKWPYANASLGAKVASLRMLRNLGDDTVVVDVQRSCIITEIQR